MTWNPVAQKFDAPPTTLAEFLLARIAEDESLATQAGGSDNALNDLAAAVAVARINRLQFAHFHQWSPARVLAECEAKRRIVELHASSGDPSDTHMCPGKSVEWLGIRNTNDGPYHYAVEHCRTLALLAVPYSDHPDYLPEWRIP